MLLVLVVLIHAQGLGNALVFDDARLTEGQFFSDYALSADLKPRWLSYGSFSLVERHFPGAWSIQRAVNVLIHVINVLLLGLLLNRLLAPCRRSMRWDGFRDLPSGAPSGSVDRIGSGGGLALWLGLAVFALNPVAVYAVSYLIQRSILMAATFALLALLATLMFLRTRRWVWFGVMLVALLAGAVSKAPAMGVVLALPALVVFEQRFGPTVWSWSALRMPIVMAALLAVGALGWLGANYQNVLGAAFDETSVKYVDELAALSPGVASHVYLLSVLNQAGAYFAYLARWLWPDPGWLSIDLRPPFPVDVLAPEVLGPALAFAALALLAGRVLLRSPSARAAAAGLLLLSSMALFASEFATVWIQDPFVLYRSYLFALPLAGMVALVALTLPRTIVMLLVALVVTVFPPMAVERVQSLSSDLNAWADAADKLGPLEDPQRVGRWRPLLNHGIFLMHDGQLDAAIARMRQSIDVGAPGTTAHHLLGLAYQASGRHAEAVDQFRAALSAGSQEAVVSVQLAESLGMIGRYDEARAALAEVLGRPMAPPLADRAHRAAALVAMSRREPATVLANLDAMSAALSASTPMLMLRVQALLLLGRADDAIGSLRLLLRNEDQLAARVTLARLLYDRGDLVESRLQFEHALTLAPDNPALRDEFVQRFQ